MDEMQKKVVADFWDDRHEKQFEEMLLSDTGTELRKLFKAMSQQTVDK